MVGKKTTKGNGVKSACVAFTSYTYSYIRRIQADNRCLR